jgi:hypothetical protein
MLSNSGKDVNGEPVWSENSIGMEAKGFADLT